MKPLLNSLCVWIEQTALSQWIQTAAWVVPSVQTVHILAIASLMGAVLMINLRLLNMVGRDQPMSGVAARFVPVIWYALPVLLVTGLLMIVGEPARALKNSVFQLKMLLVLGAIAVTLAYQLPLRRDTAFWNRRRGGTVLIAAASIALWVGIIFAGRWIAYT
jgi:hypothetical protein